MVTGAKTWPKLCQNGTSKSPKCRTNSGARDIRRRLLMWKAPASFLCGCLAALPLIGCAGNIPISGQAATVPSAAIAEPPPYYAPAARVYAAPAAVVILWPSEDSLAQNPRLWTVQGFDAVMPEPVALYRMVADQQAALARLVAS